ncbi:helicase associated domain-containing protein [Microbacterium sp.]|uniref:helicase associated domain-containing protein n=1 Tax=Microbacterium sp. TaxID=51671 RepID=UPI003F94B2C9
MIGRRREKTGAFPRLSAEGVERSDALWMQRALDNDNSAIARRLDEELPGWRDANLRDSDPRFARFCARADRIGEFRLLYGHNPRAEGKATEDESRLGYWLTRQRHRLRAGELDTDRVYYLDLHAPGWVDAQNVTEPVKSLLATSIETLASFFATEQRLPTGKGTAPREGAAYSSLEHLRSLSEGWRLTSEDTDSINRIAPGWNVDPIEDVGVNVSLLPESTIDAIFLPFDELEEE